MAGVKVKLLSCVWLFLTPWTAWSTRLLHPWDFPGKSTGVGCHFLLQGIFLTQGSNPGLPCCRQTLYRLSHWMAGGKKWTHPLPEACHSRRCLRDEWPFYFASSPPPSLICKTTWHPYPKKMVILRYYLPSFGQLAPGMKSLPCLSPLSLTHWLFVQQTELGLGNRIRMFRLMNLLKASPSNYQYGQRAACVLPGGEEDHAARGERTPPSECWQPLIHTPKKCCGLTPSQTHWP